jgi:hypothetical protein
MKSSPATTFVMSQSQFLFGKRQARYIWREPPAFGKLAA